MTVDVRVGGAESDVSLKEPTPLTDEASSSGVDPPRTGDTP